MTRRPILAIAAATTTLLALASGCASPTDESGAVDVELSESAAGAGVGTSATSGSSQAQTVGDLANAFFGTSIAFVDQGKIQVSKDFLTCDELLKLNEKTSKSVINFSKFGTDTPAPQISCTTDAAGHAVLSSKELNALIKRVKSHAVYVNAGGNGASVLTAVIKSAPNGNATLTFEWKNVPNAF